MDKPHQGVKNEMKCGLRRKGWTYTKWKEGRTNLYTYKRRGKREKGSRREGSRE